MLSMPSRSRLVGASTPSVDLSKLLRARAKEDPSAFPGAGPHAWPEPVGPARVPRPGVPLPREVTGGAPAAPSPRLCPGNAPATQRMTWGIPVSPLGLTQLVKAECWTGRVAPPPSCAPATHQATQRMTWGIPVTPLGLTQPGMWHPLKRLGGWHVHKAQGPGLTP